MRRVMPRSFYTGAGIRWVSFSLCLMSSLLSAEETALAHEKAPVQEATPVQETAPEASEPSQYDALVGLKIENIVIDPKNIFELDETKNNNYLFKLANRLHIPTREKTIRSQLVLFPGETLSQQKLEESERLLRQNGYLFDASVVPTLNENGQVDVLVETRDNWTLFPEFSFSREGGELETSIGVEERNLFGTGTRLNIRRDRDADRTSSVLAYSNRNVAGTRLQLDLGVSNLSDGESRLIRLQQPFFSLDTKWSSGFTALQDNRIDTLFSAGERSARYREDQELFSVFYGASKGLVKGWTNRWVAGLVFEDTRFEPVIDEGLAVVTPENRQLNYPFIRYRSIEDKFTTTRNLNQIYRTEDIRLGTDYSFSVGYAAEALGSDRNAAIVSASYRRGFGSTKSDLFLVQGAYSSRIEGGDLRNAALSTGLEYFRRQSEKRVFYAAANLLTGKNRDIENEISLGGDTGLRGYPAHFLNAQSTALVSLEQRYYTDFYPFQLFRIGGAIFVDAARAWGEDSQGLSSERIFANVGVGLRVASTRSSSNRVVHIDIAAPLDRPDNVDSVQFRISAQRGF